MAQSSNQITRNDVLLHAREWLGTPYMHQTSRKGVGCDCLGLLRGVWQDLYNEEAEQPPHYTAAWAEIRPQDDEPMLEAAQRLLVPVKLVDSRPGDVVLIRVRRNSAIKHCGILSENNHIIHAYDRHHVLEEPMREAWKPRHLYTFKFPGV